MMIYGNKRIAKRALFMALITTLCLIICGSVLAQGATTLTVQLKGLLYDVSGEWRAVTLSAPVDVLAPDGSLIGSVIAGASQASDSADTLTLDGVGRVRLALSEGASVDGFTAADDAEYTVTGGQANLATLFAYAEQGLFSFRGSLAEGGEPLVGAEYAVLNSAGDVLMSFTTGEDGAYAAERLLPIGDYSLVQMRAADGTMPAPPIAFSVKTYTGDASDIARIAAECERVPELNAAVGVLDIETVGFERVAGDERMRGAVTVSGVCDGCNDMRLNGATLRLSLDGLRDYNGNDARGGDGDFTELTLTGASAACDALDASGAPLAEKLALSDGQAAALPEGTRSLKISYLYNGDTALPVGYSAGVLEVKAAYTPADDEEPAALALKAECDITYLCQSSDGQSLVTASHAVKPASALISIPDKRERPILTARASGSDIVIKAEPSAYLNDDTKIIVELPRGARANEYKVDCDLYLRMRDSDAVAITWARLLEGYTLPVRFGKAVSVNVYALDPLGLPINAGNPYGASLLAQSYRNDALWDTLLGENGGVYSSLVCPFEGRISLDSLDSFTFVAASGSVLSRGGHAPDAAVVLRGKEGNLCYGNYIEANGSFVVYVPQPNQHTRNQRLDLLCMLPQGASDTETGAEGMYSTEIVMPTMGLHIVYSRKSALSGKIVDEEGEGVSGAEVELSINGGAVVSQTTDANGGFAFSELEDGGYKLTAHGGERLVLLAGEGYSVSDDGLTATFDTIELNGEEDVALSVNAMRACALKGNVTLHGAPLSGCSLELRGADGERLTRVADSEGNYSFAGLRAGEWTLFVAPPDRLVLASVGAHTFRAREGVEIPLALAAGDMQRQDVVFERTSSLSGGSHELGAGVRVVAASVDGSVETVTDANGSFRFDELAAGDYSVYIQMPSGRTISSACEWKLNAGGDMCWVTVSLEPGVELALPEIAFTTFTGLDGFAYLDINGDGARTEDEPLLTGVPVALQRSENGGWIDVASIKTDEYGKYGFDKLSPGDYRVSSGTDASGLFVATVGDGSVAGQGKIVYSALITLGDGERKTDAANIGLRQSAALRFTAFTDADRNGAKDASARSVPDVLVEVLYGGETLYSGVTDAQGELTLGSVHPGEYTLRVTAPAGYAFGVKGADSCVGGTEERTALSDATLFTGGQSVATGVGLVPVGSFGGKVFEDENNNGIMDEDEPGVDGVRLILTGSRSGGTFELVTDETGVYVFGSLPDDTYTFTAELPEGMLLARYSQSGGDLRSVFTGDTTERQYAVKGAQHVDNKNVGVIKRGVVEGVAFLDVNYNGVRDEGEPGYAGVSLELYRVSGGELSGRTVSGEDGSYRFDSLRSGEYRLRAVLPNDGSMFTKVAEGAEANVFAHREGRRENTVQPVTVGSGSSTRVLVGVATGASISGVVYEDEDYNGVCGGNERLLTGVRVRLVDAQGAEVAAVSTAKGGAYTINGIMPGSYTIEVERRTGYGFTRLKPGEPMGNHIVELKGEYGVTAPISVAMGDSISGINAGMLPSATVSGVLFSDDNDNGVRDGSESGMTDASVRLKSGDGEIDIVRAVAESGDYFFDGVMPGSYTLTFLLPEHAEPAKIAQDGNTLQNKGRETETEPFTVAMGENRVYPMAGAVRLGSFEGFVFHDINADGIADAGEERIAGVELAMKPVNAGLDGKTAKSDANGSFSITGLRPSEYKLEVTLPSGYVFSHDLSSDGVAFDTVNSQSVECSWQSLINRSEKTIGAVKPASVSGAIWLDENNNLTRGGDEALLSGVSIELVNAATGMVAKRAVSGEQGFRFDDVRPGQYRLRFALPEQSEPAGEAGAAFTPNGVYMVCDGVTVAEAQSVEGLDVGLVSRTSVGGVAQLVEGGSTIKVIGLSVSLYDSQSDAALLTAVTDEEGAYRFDGLLPGEYRIKADKPNGTVFVRPDDANYAQGASVITRTDEGESDVFSLRMAHHLTDMNIIFIKPAKIGDMAWLDSNANGLIDADEPVLPGVTVRLLKDGQAVMEAVTNQNGYYLLDDVYPGRYTLQAVAYPQLNITKSIPELRVISSCLISGDGNSASSDSFEAQSGSNNKDFDLGYVLREGQTIPELPKPDQRDWTGANTPDI